MATVSTAVVFRDTAIATVNESDLEHWLGQGFTRAESVDDARAKINAAVKAKADAENEPAAEEKPRTKAKK